jgi:hypothetical protein
MKSLKPRIVAALGLLGLLASTACFPLPTIVLPGSGPKPTPFIPVTPTPAPVVAPSVSSTVYPTPGRVYTILDRKANTTRVYTVTAIEGSIVTYDLSGGAGEKKDQKVTQTNGVFWTDTGPNPVTKAIESYDAESVTVGAGTFPCFKVVSGANTFWFCGGICVKASGPDVDFELTQLQ